MVKPTHYSESAANELIVVTGTSSGIGAATAKKLADRGFHVLAGVRREIDAHAIRSERCSDTFCSF